MNLRIFNIEYINKFFALQKYLTLRRLIRFIRIYEFDKKEIVYERITYIIYIKMYYLNYIEKIRLYVTILDKHAAILELL
jgi:hypothetical protein